jgi:hypothetical protein
LLLTESAGKICSLCVNISWLLFTIEQCLVYHICYCSDSGDMRGYFVCLFVVVVVVAVVVFVVLSLLMIMMAQLQFLYLFRESILVNKALGCRTCQMYMSWFCIHIKKHRSSYYVYFNITSRGCDGNHIL